MLRVIKPTSPMSMGTWIFSGFAGAAGVAAVAEAAPLLPDRGVLGLARRALPPIGAAGRDRRRRHSHRPWPRTPRCCWPTRPIRAGTPLTRNCRSCSPAVPWPAAAAAGLIGAPLAQAEPARRLAAAGAILELAATHRVEHGHGLLSEPYRTGRPAKLLPRPRGC